jgi:tRNA(Ile)-lysidine synthase
MRPSYLLIKYTIYYNYEMLFKSLEQILPIIEPPIIVGVSGGVDSMVLLHAMMVNDYAPIAAHFNHKLREESDLEAEFVKNYCLNSDLPFREGSGDVRGYAELHSLSIEEAARILRYRFLFEVAERESAGAVAVAHHADDQIETILMNLLRGAGTKGLAGMRAISVPNSWSDIIPVVRPLLEIDKEDLIAYHTENQLPLVVDPSNADEIYFRNKIRHSLIPSLESLKPGVRHRLLQTVQIMTAEDQALDHFTDIAWKTCLSSQGGSYLQLVRDELLDYPIAIQRRLIRKALKELRPDFEELSFLNVEAALDFIRDPSRKSSNWVAKVNLSQSPRKVVLSTWETDLVKDQFPQLVDQREISLAEPGKKDLGNGWFLDVRPVDYIPEQFGGLEIPGEDFLVWMDQAEIVSGAVLRVRQEGDSIQPLGMGGKSMKVSDLMINEKIPAPYRPDWPLVAGEKGILWVPGGRLSRDARITADTQAVLELKFIRQTA